MKVVNAGVSGETAEDGLARFDWSVPAGTDALIVELGANDMLRGLPPEGAKAALSAILDKATAAHIADAADRHARRAESWAGLRDGVRPHLSRSRAGYGVDALPVLPRRRRRRPQAQPAGRAASDGQGVEKIVASILPAVEKLLAEAPQ